MLQSNDAEIKSIVSERLLDKREVCKLLNVSLSTVQRLIKTGKLKYVKVLGSIRFKPNEIERFVEENTIDIQSERSRIFHKIMKSKL